MEKGYGRVSEIMKAVLENENKNIGLYYRDRLDFEATRDDMERRGLADSEDYASFYGEQFENYYNRVAGDTPLVMIGSELGYNAGQLGNDWEDKASILHNEASPFN